MKRILISIGILLVMGAGVVVSFAQNTDDDVLQWMTSQKLTRYTTWKEFRPNDPITRGEASKFFVQYATILDLDMTTAPCKFSDTSRYDASLKPFITQACQYGLLKGKNGAFMPSRPLTQAQGLAIIMRSLFTYVEPEPTDAPRYELYTQDGIDVGLIDESMITTLDSKPITRKLLAQWLYKAYLFNEEGVDDASDDEIVYESDVDGPDQCTSYEQYDNDSQTCSFVCTTEQQCTHIQQQIDDEIAQWGDALEATDRNVDETPDTDTQNQKVLYTVKAGEQIQLQKGEDLTLYRELRETIARFSPDALSDRFIEDFQVYDDPQSDTIAYVADDDANTKRSVSLNLSVYQSQSLQEKYATLIHELAHIITLNSDQLTPDVSSCATYQTDEGCAQHNAYLYAFVSKFWKNTKSPSFDETKFVTDYATTNQEEDIAESFAFFVLESDFQDDTVRNQKVNFFNTYPELVQTRKDIRAVLSQAIIRARKK